MTTPKVNYNSAYGLKNAYAAQSKLSSENFSFGKSAEVLENTSQQAKTLSETINPLKVKDTYVYPQYRTHRDLVQDAKTALYFAATNLGKAASYAKDNNSDSADYYTSQSIEYFNKANDKLEKARSAVERFVEIYKDSMSDQDKKICADEIANIDRWISSVSSLKNTVL